MFWIAAAVFVLVEGLLLFFVFRYRRRKGRPAQMPPQIHGNNRLEIAWTILPALILAGVAVPTVTTIFDLAREPPGNVLEVNVLAHQWWWEFDYPAEGIITANELHIPTGRPSTLTLCAVGLGYQYQPDAERMPAGTAGTSSPRGRRERRDPLVLGRPSWPARRTWSRGKRTRSSCRPTSRVATRVSARSSAGCPTPT